MTTVEERRFEEAQDAINRATKMKQAQMQLAEALADLEVLEKARLRVIVRLRDAQSALNEVAMQKAIRS